jgi:predicted PurR-regulated permease PerM
MNNSRLNKVVSIGIILVIITATLVFFKEILKPLAVALIVWYIIRALQNFIGGIKIKGRTAPRWLSGTLSLLIISLILQVSINLIVDNLSLILINYKTYQSTFVIFFAKISAFIGVEDLEARIMGKLEGLNLQAYLNGVLSSLTTVLSNLIIVLIYLVFLLLEEVSLKKKMRKLFHNEHTWARFQAISDQIYTSTNKYITLKTYVSLLTAGLSYVVLVIIGVDYAFLWAFLIFLFNYIPYIGSLIATLLPALFAILQFGSFWPFFWVLLFVESVQLVVGNYVEPKIMGKSLNLSPLVVVITLSFWGYLWDILGMVISVPITSIMLIVLAQFPTTRNISILLSENGEIDDLVVKNPPVNGENNHSL